MPSLTHRMIEIIENVRQGNKFLSVDALHALPAGSARTSLSSLLDRLKTAGVIKRVARGEYQVTSRNLARDYIAQMKRKPRGGGTEAPQARRAGGIVPNLTVTKLPDGSYLIITPRAKYLGYKVDLTRVER